MANAPLRLLVVEDSLALRTELATLLEAQGHQVDFAADGRTGLALALAHPPDVLILDLGLPGMDGLRVCERLRLESARHVPVLMLTARDALPDKVRGFEAGADDYLVKPFAAAELLARCLALARRHRVGEPVKLVVGPLAIDRRSGEVTREGHRIALPHTPYRLLLALAEAWPRTLTRSDLVQRVWGDEPPHSDPLRTHLYVLRQALDKPYAAAMLRTVHGVGFRLEANP